MDHLSDVGATISLIACGNLQPPQDPRGTLAWLERSLVGLAGEAAFNLTNNPYGPFAH